MPRLQSTFHAKTHCFLLCCFEDLHEPVISSIPLRIKRAQSIGDEIQVLAGIRHPAVKSHLLLPVQCAAGALLHSK